MAEERRRRRRGRRRGRGGEQPSGRPPEERPEEGQPEVTEESEAPGVLPSRLRFRFGRRGGGEEEEEKAREPRDRGREERPAAAAPVHVSPLSFWRRGRTRSYREQPMPRRTLGRTLRRIRGLHFPPWLPVVFIILVVFGVLGVLFFVRSATGAPRQGDDWYAAYEVIICGEREPNIPGWDGGVHTLGQGDIHIRPRSPSEEGAGARLVKWFEYGGDALGTGAKLTETELQLPGQRDIWKNGDECPDGTEGVLQVFVNGQQMDNWSRYIPQNGDQVRIVFGPEEETEAADEAEATEEPGATEEPEGPEATDEAEGQPQPTEAADGE